MANKVIIASDSTCDLSPELIAKYNIQILPLGVNFGDKKFTDGVDIDPEYIYKRYNETKELPKTSAANIDEFISFFKKYTDEGYDLVMFTISSEMSSTYNNGRLAASEVGNVYVVDSRNLSTGSGLLVLNAAELALDGYCAEDIANMSREKAAYVDASFVIDSLEFLHKGGRCSGLAAFGANLLSLKPCINVKCGKMGVGKKYRGKYEVTLTQYIKERLSNMDDIDTKRVFVTHAGCSDDIVKKCVDTVKACGKFDEILVTRAGCTVSSHCGRNTLGVLFIRKSEVV